MDTFQQDTQQEVRTWEMVFCTTPSCQHSFLWVDRSDEALELWGVASKLGEAEWRIAAVSRSAPTVAEFS